MVKRPGHKDYHPFPSRTEVRERVVTPLFLLWTIMASYRVNFTYVEIKANWMEQNSFIANLLSAQHVSGVIMPIIRSSRVIQMVAACGT